MAIRKIVIGAGFVAVSVILGIAFWLFTIDRPSISLKTFDKIEEGMTREQVYAILGGPPRWDVTPAKPEQKLFCLFHKKSWQEEWWGRDGVIIVSFRGDIAGVKYFGKLPFEPVPPTIWELVIRPIQKVSQR